MKIQLDTSVLVAMQIEKHPKHKLTADWFDRVTDEGHQLICAAHSLAEFYATATSFPASPRISPVMALRLISENIHPHIQIRSLSETEHWNALERLVALGIQGGTIYDGLISEVGRLLNVDLLVTFNTRDFKRVWPEAVERIVEPS